MKNLADEPEREALIQGYLEGSLTEDESTRLRSLLQQDPAIVDSILTGLRDDHLIRAVVAEWVVASPAKPSRTVHAPLEILERMRMILTSLRRYARATTVVGAAAFAALLVVFWLWCFGSTVGTPVLAQVQGTGIVLERSHQSLAPTPGMSLREGDILRTSEGATAVIGFAPENTRLTLLPGTEFKLATFSRGKRFDLDKGKLEASVARQRPFYPMVISTPQAEARVVGTRFMLTVTTNATRLDVAEGQMKFTRKTDEMAVKVGAEHYVVATANYELAALPFTGTILREWWSGVTAQTLQNDPRLWDHPDGSYMAQFFELEPVKTNRVVVRFRGYLHPPVTGDYEFWLAGATDSTLFMSPGENPADKVKIAVSWSSVGIREWEHARSRTQGSSQRSSPIPLVAGKRYYIEATLFIEKGEGHLSVAWKRPGASRELLTGEYLSPFKPR